MALTLKVTALSKWGSLYFKTNYYLWKGVLEMMYSQEVEEMICVAKGPNHGPAPIPKKENG